MVTQASFGYLFFALGGLLCILNFYLTFLQFVVYRLQGKESECRWDSGIPLFGSGFVVLALLFLQEPIEIFRAGVVLLGVGLMFARWEVELEGEFGAFDKAA